MSFSFLDSLPTADSNSSLESLVSFRSTASSQACSDSAEEVSNVTTIKEGVIHASCSAPELTAAQKTASTKMATIDGDGDGVTKSLLHSLSCLTLMFPQLHKGWSLSPKSPKDSGDWISSRSLSEQYQDLVSGRPGLAADRPGPNLGPVRFQLGGLNEEEEEEDSDWCEPIDAIAQRRLVPFRRYTAVT